MNKHVAVTGASSGIGEALCRELVRAGYKVTMIARRGELLRKMAAEIGGQTHVIEHDLSIPERATEWIAPAEAALGPIDILVNNAGIQIIGRYDQMTTAELKKLLDLDLMTPLLITRAILPKMLARKDGVIVDVSSMAGIAPTPFMTAYNAAKGGLAAASESLRGELLGSGVHVVTVYPGPVETPMGIAGYAAYEPTFAARATPVGTAPVLARLMRRAIERRRARVIYPRVYAISRWFPNTTRWFLDHFTPKPRTLASGSPTA